MFEIENRVAERERHRENSSRAGEATATFRSTGQGSIEFGERVTFGLTFMTKPIVSYCAEIDLDQLDEQLNTDPHESKTPTMPIVSGFVTDWDTDARGFYVGAYCGARVYYPESYVLVIPNDGETPPVTTESIPISLPVQVLHNFRFSAVAMKDIPTELTDY